ncbi:MAG: PRC-barrel domain containing protein [Firmicutes bacterium]|nr:PRC-barrel domain containing protein [Bacillota bacterium]
MEDEPQPRAYPLAGQKILSEDGTFIGQVEDFSFDPETGAILALHLRDLNLEDFGREALLSAEAIRNLGKDFVLATSSFHNHLHPLDKSNLRDRPIEMAKEITRSLEIRAVEFSIGREAAYRVQDNKGAVLINKGEKITEDIIDRARKVGKLYQILFAAGVGELLEGIDFTREKLDKGSKRLLEAWELFKKRSHKFFQKEDEAAEEEAEKDMPPGINELSTFWERIEKELQEGTRQLSEEVKTNVKSFLLNKKTSYSIFDEEGNCIIKEGDTISPISLEEAEKKEKLAELFMTVLTGEIKSNIKSFADSVASLFARKH